MFFYITAQKDGHAELVSASHCEPLLTPFSRWDHETSSGWHLESLVIYTLIFGKPIQDFCLIPKTPLITHCSQLTTNRSKVFSETPVAGLRSQEGWCRNRKSRIWQAIIFRAKFSTTGDCTAFFSCPACLFAGKGNKHCNGEKRMQWSALHP